MDVAVKPELLLAMDRPLVLPWWRRRHWQQALIAGGVLLLLVLAAVVLIGPAQRTFRMSMAGASIATVERSVFRDFIPLRGEVTPLDTVYLDALEGGRVDRILVQAGDHVEAGQPLVEFTNTELELEVLNREGTLVQSITGLQAQETQLEQNRAANDRLLADIEYDVIRLQRAIERRRELAARQLVSAESLDELRDQLDRAQRQYRMQQESNARQETLRQQQSPQIRMQMERLQESLEIIHGKLRNLVARAPVAGLVTQMELKVGESRSRGERLAEITPQTGYRLTATIDEYYLGRVREGQVAQVERQGRQWPLRVERVYPQVKEGGFRVDLAFTGGMPGGLLRGQSLQGRLSLGEDVQGLVLASGAFLEASGGDWAFVLDAGGRSAQRRRIKLGRRNAEQVEVLSGLEPGERVIVSEYTGLDRIERIDLTK
jgi:HlyD family secretion protein